MRNEIVIVGAGESGIGAALLAKKLDQTVYVTDAGLIKEKYKEELINNKIDFEESGHDFDRLQNAKLAIVSPGIPDSAKPIQVLMANGVEIISEIEYGYRNTNATIIAITGSNGKTTTTGLIYHILRDAEYDVAVGGNYGIAMCRVLAERQPNYFVLELSSFQLEKVDTFKADIAIILNITPDHLDRYEYNMDLYVEAKMNIVNNQTKENTIIYNGDDKNIQNNLNNRILPSTRRIQISTKDYITGLVSSDTDLVFQTQLKGIHNLFNARCAIAASRQIGLTEIQIASGLATFTNMAHRMESITVIKGVQYINDSKATNVDAVFYALDAMTTPVIWIAGGADKGNDYNQIEQLVKKKVKVLICLTAYPEPLTTAFGNVLDEIVITENVDEAIKIAAHYAEDGDTVLLSPACASFDLFNNYMDRGEQFRISVLNQLRVSKSGS